MKIAVLSGKGGTGKTLLSVNLAAVAKKSLYIDCDVEEPNGHLFFKPKSYCLKNIFVRIPRVDEKCCKGCRKCVDFCRFNALAYTGKRVVIFDEVCHSCGGCALICPEKAISENNKVIGVLQTGVSDNVQIRSGILNTGEASGIPIIKALLEAKYIGNELTFIDCPPGSACSVMESIKDADYCVLVAEPTVFGAHNLKMIYELVCTFGKRHGVVLNKCLEGENPSELFCQNNDIRILGRIPYDNELGILNSNAVIAAREKRKYSELFSALLKTVVKEAGYESIVDPQR